MTDTLVSAETEPATSGERTDLVRLQEFALQVATDAARAKAGALTYVGHQLGLWRAMNGAGPLTSTELAARTGTTERYVREWLADQAVVGYLEVDPTGRWFTLPHEHAAVLAEPASPAYGMGALEGNIAFFGGAERLVEVMRTGEGILWGDHHPALYTAVDAFFRALYSRSLVQEWLPALDGVVARLERGATVLDVGCGYGTADILMAQAFPASRFHGVDLHAGSVEAARRAAEEAGVSDRVTFAVGDAAALAEGQEYDLACFFDAFHHVGDPVRVAAEVRDVLRPDGTLVLVEPLAGDDLRDNMGVVGLTYYGASVIVCLTDAIAQGAGADALGGQAGPARLAEVLHRAGYGDVRVAARADFNLVVEARR